MDIVGSYEDLDLNLPYGVSTNPVRVSLPGENRTDSFPQSRLTLYNRGMEVAEGSSFLTSLYAVSLPAQSAHNMASWFSAWDISSCSSGVKTRLMNRVSRLFPIFCGSVRSTISLPMRIKITFLHLCHVFDYLLCIVALSPESVFFC